MTPTLTLVLSSLLFAGLGIVVFALAFWLLDRLTPYDLWKEIVEKQNVALSILLGAALVALGLIISAAIHG